MVRTASTQDSVQAVASFDDSSSTVYVIEGRGSGCRDVARCDGMVPPAPPEPVSTNVSLPWRSGTVKVTGTKVSGASIGPSGQPAVQIAQAVAVPPDGVITIPLSQFDDGDAWTFTISRA
jgi:hypothetical protein